MTATKFLKLCLAFLLVSLVAATSLTGCSTQTNPTCGEVWSRCRANNKEQYCRDLLCETWRTMCDDCDICHNISQTSFPTPIPAPAPAVSAAAPQGGCNGPQCAAIFSRCDSSLQWCRDLVCETNSYICGDCPICFNKSITTFPPAAPKTSSSTLSTITFPAGSITITAGNPVWPTNPPADPTSPLSSVKRNIADNKREANMKRWETAMNTFKANTKRHNSVLESTKRSPQDVLDDEKKEYGYACNTNSCARICMTVEYIQAYRHFPHVIWIPEATSTSPYTITLPASQFCSQWTCSSSGCRCSSAKAPSTVKRNDPKRTGCRQICNLVAPGGYSCYFVCKNDIYKRGDCWEQCDDTGHDCSIVCSASKQKRQCQQTCDKDGKTCLTDCTTDPKETCFEICDKNGKCTQECSLIGQMEKRQCWKQCDENGENCGEACKTVPEKTCFEVCDKTGKCHSECSLIGEAEKREIELDD